MVYTSTKQNKYIRILVMGNNSCSIKYHSMIWTLLIYIIEIPYTWRINLLHFCCPLNWKKKSCSTLAYFVWLQAKETEPSQRNIKSNQFGSFFPFKYFSVLLILPEECSIICYSMEYGIFFTMAEYAWYWWRKYCSIQMEHKSMGRVIIYERGG